jgi:2-polyprenyl-3-methyl-5-hydroxy-6-metoxy-1,4-benzoquinol methylase
MTPEKYRPSESNPYFVQTDRCPVCHEAVNLKLEFDLNYFSSEVLDVNSITSIPEIKMLRCLRCNHYFSSHILQSGILDNYYSKISSIIYKDASNSMSDGYAKERKIHASLIEKLYPNGGKILDVGCGYGFLLSYLNNSWDRYGIEPSQYAASIARQKGITILSEYIDQVPLAPHSFDVILLIDVMEHLSDPQHMIKRVFDLLKKDGTLLIFTGNIDSLNSKLVGPKWSYFNSYEHISFYNPKSIRYLLKKNNFQKIRIKKTSWKNGLMSNSYNLFKNFLRFILFKQLKLREIHMSPLAFDHMLILAQKEYE